MNKSTPSRLAAISGRRPPEATLAEPGRPAPQPAAPMRAVATIGKAGNVGMLTLALAFAAGCSNEDGLSVVISLPEQHLPLATRATLIVDYSGTGTRLLSNGDDPDCAFTLPGVDGEFSDDREGTLTIHATGPRAMRGPSDIAACRMKASDETATAADLASRLTVRVEGAEDAAGKPIDIAAAAATRHDGGAGTRLSEVEIEQAQAKAVDAAATITKAAREEAKAKPAVTGEADTGKAGTATAGEPGTAPAAPGAQTPPPSAARAAAPGNIARTAGAALPVESAPEVIDDSAMPGGDRDPGYDDSPADDDTAPSYSLDFYVPTAGTFGALQLDINHLGNSGGFIGREDKVDCVSLLPHDRDAMVASNYLGERLTKIGIISLDGFDTPAKVLRCGFRTRENLSPGSFLIEVADASDPRLNPIEPAPTVFISSITPRR